MFITRDGVRVKVDPRECIGKFYVSYRSGEVTSVAYIKGNDKYGNLIGPWVGRSVGILDTGNGFMFVGHEVEYTTVEELIVGNPEDECVWRLLDYLS